jgi:hypothetical protein
MDLPDLSNRPALWLGLRQAESLREAVNLPLNGKPLPVDSISKWLRTQGLEWSTDAPETPAIWTSLDNGFTDGVGISPGMLVRGSNAPLPEWTNLGEERAGAGWKDPANFIITSAFVRLLGASEQFELDVLKSLLYYRPQGLLGHEADWIEQTVDCEVIREVPQPDEKSPDVLVYAKPPIWTWLRRHAENNIERTRVFKQVFGLSTVPPDHKPKQKQEWYDKRNAIAQGRAGVKMTLREYIEVDVFVAKSMLFLSGQCRERLKLLL